MKRVGLFLLLLMWWYSAVPASPPIVGEISFQIAGRANRTAELFDAAQHLVTLRESQPMDTGTLKESIDALRMCGLFEEVAVDTGNGNVVFLLVPARYVRDIGIRQEYPLFQEDVEKALSTYPGDIFRDEMLLRQDSLVGALYRREGFIAPRVEVTSTGIGAGPDRKMQIRVHSGAYLRLKTVAIKGNRAFSSFQLRRRLKIWQASLVPGSAGRFVDAVFHEDCKMLADYYRLRGFTDVVIHDTVVADTATRLVRAVISIDEGDRYRLVFPQRRRSGFSKKVLKKDVAIRAVGNRRYSGMQKSIESIKQRLNDAGYLHARVTAADTLIKYKRFTEHRVRFTIVRGTRTLVSSITVEGAAGIGEAAVREQMLHVDKGSQVRRAYSALRLQDDVFAVQLLCRSLGFSGATVASNVALHENAAVITMKIKEGPHTLVRSVSADVARFPGIDIGKVVTIKKGDPFRSDQIKREAQELQMMIAGRGFPHAAVTPVVALTGDSSSADIDFRISEGPLVTLGDIRYVGAFRTREKVLSSEFKTLPGKPLSLKDIVDAQKGVRNLGLFSSVRFRTFGLREKQDTVHVFVEVAEKRPLYGSVSGGYQSDKGPFIQAKVGDRNIGGLNKEVWAGGEVSLIGYRGETGLIEPRLFGSHLRAMVDVFGEKYSELNQRWWSTAYGVTSGITASPARKLLFGLGSTYERRRLFSVVTADSNNSGVVPDSLRPRNIVVLKPSFSWDRRDSFTRPRKGISIGSSVNLSKSIKSDIDDFVKLRFEMKGFVTPFPPLTLAGVVRGGYLQPFGAAGTVPADQRFYLGGTGDVRGFAENLFHPADSGGGNVSLCATIEARIALGGNFELALFSDVGRLEDTVFPLLPDQFRSSVGGGIRYITPIGPIGLLYGRKMKPLSDEAPGAFHFSLGYSF